ncbi:MAG: LamB/YcsF family protein [Deltaproteobacteria bacterium]|nr:LamB/YcsF family protein [Deltaproteobacteria bacterium]
MKRVDVNADLGEGFADEALVPWITSASVACGYHAGDRATMERTVALCRARGVSVGAHPGLPDREGFGRHERPVRLGEVRAWVSDQVRALAAVAAAQGVPLRHLKPHGALYHMAARDEAVAGEVVAGALSHDEALVLIVPPGSVLERRAKAEGLRVAREGFPERGYLADGRLAPRGLPGALVTDPLEAASRAVGLCLQGSLRALDGSEVRLEVDTLCLHGDSPGAALVARTVREALEGAGVEVAPL